MNVVDFFSGCGGASEGLRQAGFDIILGLDFDKDAAATYRSNFPEASFIEGDIREVRESVVKQILNAKAKKNKPTLFAACAPCQPFSKQNRSKKEVDLRRSLLDETHRFIKEIKPDYIMLENVPGIQKVDEDEDGPYKNFLEFIYKLGYEYNAFIAKSESYGVPQRRKRFVLIASLNGKVPVPDPIHGENLNPYKTVRDYIGEYPAIKAGEASKFDALHKAAGMESLNLKRISITPEGGDRRDWPESLLNKCHKEYKGHTDTYGRMSWDKPAPTLTTKCYSYSNGRFGHPDIKQHRAISIREASRLQTFPPDYIFHGNLAAMARQIGNAVPCKLAKEFGIAIHKYDKNKRY